MDTILIVEDDKDLRSILSNILKNEGYGTAVTGDGKRALKEVKMRAPNLVLLDIKLPGIDGMQILEELKQIDKDLIIIMLTAFGDVKGAVKAMKLGAFDYVTKPFNNEELLLIIKKALKTQYLSKEVERLRQRLGEKIALEEVMGESQEIKRTLNQVKMIAPTNVTVILQGESGSGKELIANMIHQNSLRKDRPFVAIDCGAMPATLIESELFGYEKGAFTGADVRKSGRFEEADGGTLFLDEIKNLSIPMQMKFLRVIQEMKIQRLGSTRNIKVDVRLIAASSADLSETVREGSFRHDFFHRLNEFQINIPPLRERREDIPILTNHFVEEANAEFGKKIKGFSKSALRCLLDYAWPGNVRELKNVVRRAVLLSDSRYIEPSVLSPEVVRASDAIPEQLGLFSAGMDISRRLDEGASFEEITKKVEKDLIERALLRAGGNKVKAAKLLRMDRKALYRKMKSLGMPVNNKK